MDFSNFSVTFTVGRMFTFGNNIPNRVVEMSQFYPDIIIFVTTKLSYFSVRTVNFNIM